MSSNSGVSRLPADMVEAPESKAVAIRIHDVSKCYQIYGAPHDRLKQFLLPNLQRLAGRPSRKYFREFWALRNVSLDIRKGETVGIVGRNGSGKSTLLQIICGTLNPTGGIVETNGRVAALLELGSGFNPEFSGRENVYMNASVLGLKKEEIDVRFDDIAAFADIGSFIEQPVKTYSSGMMVRLAFAVAVSVDPEILIVDEALSVGDELFQRKCFSRIEAIRDAGATILFVSHSGSAVVELCDRAVLMDAGEKLAVGSPKQIVGCYQKLLYAPADKRGAVREEICRTESTSPATDTPPSLLVHEHAGPGTAPLRETFDPHLKSDSVIEFASHGVHITSPMLLTPEGEQVNGLVRGRKYRYYFKVRFERSASSVRFGMLIKTTSGLPLGGILSAPTLREAIAVVEAGATISVEFTFHCHLNPGVYFMNAGAFGMIDSAETVLHRIVDAVAFRVLPVNSNTSTEIVDFGCVSLVSLDE
jgi:lipopolysaccharide transport system ATP-binding protein